MSEKAKNLALIDATEGVARREYRYSPGTTEGRGEEGRRGKIKKTMGSSKR